MTFNKTVEQSRAYAKILNHRRKCKKWGKAFCLDCFGGGLNKFMNDLGRELGVDKR